MENRDRIAPPPFIVDNGRMIKNSRLFFSLALVFVLSACGFSREIAVYDGPLTPLPAEFMPRDPGNRALTEALDNYFVEKKAVQTVYEEGFEGIVPTDHYFNMIENKEIRERVAYFLLDHLRLGGAEYAHITREKDFKLVGADSLDLHFENLSWYQKNALVAEDTEKDLEKIKSLLMKLANQRFSKEVRNWLKLKERVRHQEIPFATALLRWTQVLPDDLNLHSYPVLNSAC